MEFEQPEMAAALRELAIEQDGSFSQRRQTYVDYDAEGRIGSRRAAQFEHWHLLADADPYRGIKGYMLCVIDHRLSSTESR